MNLIESTKTCLTKYFVFSGRASRSEFWWFQLFVMILTFVGLSLDALLIFGSYEKSLESELVISFTNVLGLSMLIPIYSVFFRRLHDVNRSGWWIVASYSFIIFASILADNEALLETNILFLMLFFLLVGIVLTFIIVYWCIKKGDVSSNKYGSKPVK